MQTYLEKKGLAARHETIIRNDYNKEDEYSVTHKDALATGDAQGKGTGHGGHTHSIPNYNLSQTAYNYGSIDTTTNSGGLYDVDGYNGIGGRNFLTNINTYGPNYEYGPNIVDTTANVQDGQIVI